MEKVKYYEGDAEIVKDLDDEAGELLLPISTNPTPLQLATPTLVFCGMFFATFLGALWLIINAFQ